MKSLVINAEKTNQSIMNISKAIHILISITILVVGILSRVEAQGG